MCTTHGLWFEGYTSTHRWPNLISLWLVLAYRENVYDKTEEFYVVVKERGQREEQQSQEEIHRTTKEAGCPTGLDFGLFMHDGNVSSVCLFYMSEVPQCLHCFELPDHASIYVCAMYDVLGLCACSHVHTTCELLNCVQKMLCKCGCVIIYRCSWVCKKKSRSIGWWFPG